jgi:hypothetical protein
MKVDTINVISQKRIERIKVWLGKFESAQELMIRITDILDRLRFGVRAEKFEAALDELGHALGFECQRPDKQWGRGPDNLWGLTAGEFAIFECKSEVDLQRAEIAKNESGQMNNSCAWFDSQYPGASVTPILIIPTHRLGPASGFNREVRIMRAKELGALVRNSKAFFESLRNFELRDLSGTKLQNMLDQNSLSAESLRELYSTLPRGANQ